MQHFCVVLVSIVAFLSAAAAQEPPAQPHAAQAQCSLRQYASLPIEIMDKETPAVRVPMNGRDARMAVDFSLGRSIVTEAFARQLELEPVDFETPFYKLSFMGRVATKQVIVGELKIGAAVGRDVHLIMLPDQARPDYQGSDAPVSDGFLTADILGKFDVEIDPANARLNVFSQEHCPGQVVYWAASYASIPFEPNRFDQNTFGVQLNGVPVKATLGGGGSIGMNLSTAKRLFGLVPDSKGMVVTARDANGNAAQYRYPFKALALEALTIRNPEVYIERDSAPFPCDNSIHFTDLKRDSDTYSRCTGPDMWIGFHELKKLHAYFAFGEKKLYLTAADASHGEPKKITP